MILSQLTNGVGAPDLTGVGYDLNRFVLNGHRIGDILKSFDKCGGGGHISGALGIGKGKKMLVHGLIDDKGVDLADGASCVLDADSVTAMSHSVGFTAGQVLGLFDNVHSCYPFKS